MAASPAAQHAMTMPEDADDRHVSMSNRLARSAQGLNLGEKRLVALSLAGTDSVPVHRLVAAQLNAGWKITVTAMEYAETFGVDPTTAYEQLKAASEKLFERKVIYEVKGRRGKPEIKTYRWVSSCRYAEGEGFVELNFTPELAPHLLGLRKQFTSYKLRHAAALDSVYAWRLFEVFKSWQSTGLYTTTIEDFWEAMEAPPSCRKDFKSLRTRIIEPSIEAIRTKANMLVEWKQLRSGSRRVTGLEFRFVVDPQARLDIEPVQDDLIDEHSDMEQATSD